MSQPQVEQGVGAAPPAPGRAQVFASPVFWALVVLAAIAVPGVPILWARASTPPPPVLGTLPAFTFTDQLGQPFGSDALEGKVWVANFIFTRCPTICPAFTKKMAAVQDEVRGQGEQVQLVSFSVDPDFDTPEVLRAYADKYGAEPAQWRFLTGDPKALQATVVEGLKISMGRKDDSDDVNSIFHGTHFVLVDGASRIRGYYRSEDAPEVERLLRELQILTENP